MKTRTAVWITIAIVIANSAITWFAIKAWLAIPGRHWPPNRWHIELGNLSEALAASASAGAALAALWAASVALRVADRDRRDRQQEREDEEKTHARLVRLSVETRLAVLVNRPDFRAHRFMCVQPRSGLCPYRSTPARTRSVGYVRGGVNRPDFRAHLLLREGCSHHAEEVRREVQGQGGPAGC
jgi:hypothetical protein